MDTSETNIKMCEKAEEIQENHQWQDWDYGYDIETETVEVKVATWWQETLKDYNVPILGDEYYESWFWLPRQDQLQEMVALPTWKLIYEFSLWFSALMEVEAEPIWKQYSMEQLWLAFVMSELYKKTWNGTDWVKEKILTGI